MFANHRYHDKGLKEGIVASLGQMRLEQEDRKMQERVLEASRKQHALEVEQRKKELDTHVAMVAARAKVTKAMKSRGQMAKAVYDAEFAKAQAEVALEEHMRSSRNNRPHNDMERAIADSLIIVSLSKVVDDAKLALGFARSRQTNLEEAIFLGYETFNRNYAATGSRYEQSGNDSTASTSTAYDAAAAKSRTLIFENWKLRREFRVDGDGACLFRSLAKLIWLTQNEHATIREAVCDFLERHGDHFEAGFFCDNQNLANYVRNMRKPHTWGNEYELLAAATVFELEIIVYDTRESVERVFPVKPLFGVRATRVVELHYNGGHYNPLYDDGA